MVQRYDPNNPFREIKEAFPNQITTDWKAMYEVLKECNTTLERERDELKEQLECERMRLTACGVAAMANTEESRNAQLISKDNPYFSASYQDVLDAVEREMKLRTENAMLKARLEPIETAHREYKNYPSSAIVKRDAYDKAISKCMELKEG